MSWFEVDRKGLAKLLERRGKEFAVFEIISNAWDTNAQKVTVTLQALAGVPKASLVVEDDHPTGFTDLSHAFTLFAESEKKDKSDKRGRFNLGEKLVLALCDRATISSTKGTITFDESGRKLSKKATETGSVVSMQLRLTHAETAETLAKIKTLIPPVTTIVNGETLPTREPLAEFIVELPTEIADAEGNLKRARRKTEVYVYDVLPGETAMLYEMGVPVVETDDKWHVSIDQKVPLNMDRDNVPPAFLREVRTAVVNHLHTKLTDADANQPWVREATSDEDCSPEATEKVMTLRFGEQRVAYDPSDPEANSLAVSKGFTVVHGGMMNATEWDNAKKAGAILPAGKVTPSPKPFSPDGKPLKMVSPKDYTAAMHNVIAYSIGLAKALLDRHVVVEIANDLTWPFNAAYGSGMLYKGKSSSLVFNLGRLGHSFFEAGPGPELNRLLIHEFGHEYEGDHLSEKYHEVLCTLGAKLAQLALDKPTLFTDHQGNPP